MANYVSTLTGPQMDAALLDMADHNSEAWAVGTRDGEAVSSADVTYHNNAEYYATNAQSAAARAEAAVPPSTAGAVFFDRVQSLTDAQKTRAQTNIGAQSNNGGVLQIDSGLTIGTKTFINTNVQTGGAGWYRVAVIDLTRGGNTSQIFQGTGVIILNGFYNAYKPTKGVFAFTYDGGSVLGNIVQLGGVLSTSPTQIRIVNSGTGHAQGTGLLFVDLYYANTGNIRQTVSIIASARNITMQEPELITGTPTGETVRATLNISTIATGAVIKTDLELIAPTSLADLRNQLITRNNTLSNYSTSFYAMKPTTAFSPFGARTYQIELFRIDAYSMICTFKGVASTSGIQIIGMSKSGSTWSTPAEIS